MIYTIGHKESYEEYFRQREGPCKLGREPGYDGGRVWFSEKEARSHCPPGYEVYGVEADWVTETTPSADGDSHDLLKTSPLVKLTPCNFPKESFKC